jgi:hypothetical protein
MQIKWKTLIGKTIVWLAAEICLNFLGLDNLADYSEFLNLSFVLRHWSIVFAINPSLLDHTKQGEKNQWIFLIG